MEGEISLEEFFKLPETPEGGGGRKVNYDAVIEEILNRPLTAKAIAEIMLKHSTDKEKVWYSEVTRFLKTLAKKPEYEVLVRSGSVKYFLVRKKE